jgi:transposase
MKMQKRTLLFLIVAVIGMGLLCGCEEEGVSEGKRDRLVALENMELKEALKERESEIAEQKESLASCMEEREALLEQRKQNLESIMGDLFETVGKENARLVKENEELKARVAELEEQLNSQ